MSDEAFGYSTTGEVLLALQVGDALKESVKAECPAYTDVFLERAKAAEAAGENEIARAWALLAHLCRVTLRASEPTEPFRPVWEDAGGRTLVPGDMDEESAAAVRQLGFVVSDAELRSRAARRYLGPAPRRQGGSGSRRGLCGGGESAVRIPGIGPHTPPGSSARRGLARQLRDRSLVDDVLEEVENRVVELDGSDPLYLSCRLMDLLHDFGRGDPDLMRGIAVKGARLAEDKGDFERARTWHDLVGRWCRRAGDDEGEKAARLAAAASLHQQADQCSGPGQEFVAVHFLEKGP